MIIDKRKKQDNGMIGKINIKKVQGIKISRIDEMKMREERRRERREKYLSDFSD